MIRVVVADDSATARSLLVRILESDPEIQVVGEARGVGLIGAVQIVADKTTSAALPAAAGIGPLIQQSAMDRGVLLRAAPDAVYVCPPLIITRAEIDELIEALSAALDDGYAEAVRRSLVGGAVKQAAV